eukprot:1161414-Pelagomonas_calceolata.AAC.3
MCSAGEQCKRVQTSKSTSSMQEQGELSRAVQTSQRNAVRQKKHQQARKAQTKKKSARAAQGFAQHKQGQLALGFTEGSAKPSKSTPCLEVHTTVRLSPCYTLKLEGFLAFFIGTQMWALPMHMQL